MSSSSLLRDKFHELDEYGIRAMLDIIDNPTINKVTTTRLGYELLLEAMLPDIINPTRLQLLDALGYIKINPLDSVDAHPTIMRVLHYLAYNPSASQQEISDNLGIVRDYVSRLVNELAIVNGFVLDPKTRGDHRRIEFYDYMGWLNRAKMHRDAVWLQREDEKPRPPRLFPRELTFARQQVLYYIYTHPFATRGEVIAQTYCSIMTYHAALWDQNGSTSSRIAMFTRLGYVHVPNRLPQKIINYWRVNPGATQKDTAAHFGVPEKTMSNRIYRMYDKLGYTRKFRPKAYQRLGFYWYMGWFDMHQLADDAHAQFEALQERT